MKKRCEKFSTSSERSGSWPTMSVLTWMRWMPSKAIAKALSAEEQLTIAGQVNEFWRRNGRANGE